MEKIMKRIISVIIIFSIIILECPPESFVYAGIIDENVQLETKEGTWYTELNDNYDISTEVGDKIKEIRWNDTILNYQLTEEGICLTKETLLPCLEEGAEQIELTVIYEDDTQSEYTIFVNNTMFYKLTFLIDELDENPKIIYVMDGETFDLSEIEAPTKENYDFIGWYDGEKNVVGTITLKADLNLLARFKEKEAKTFDITYRLQVSEWKQDANPITSYTYSETDETILPTASDLECNEDYEFLGWSIVKDQDTTNQEVITSIEPKTEGNLVLQEMYRCKDSLDLITIEGTNYIEDWYNKKVTVKPKYNRWEISKAEGILQWKDSIEVEETSTCKFVVRQKNKPETKSNIITVNIQVDKEAPTVDGDASVTDFDGTVIEKRYDGIYTNKDVYVLVKVKEEQSGFQSAELYCDDSFVTETDVLTEGVVKLAVTEIMSGKLKVVLKDKAGNRSNEIDLFQTFVYTKEEAQVNFEIDTDPIINEDKNWYKGDSEITIKVSDSISGIKSVTINSFIEVDGEKRKKNLISEDSYESLMGEMTYEFDTSDLEVNEQGQINFEVIVCNNAGNEKTEISDDFNFDTFNPIIDESGIEIKQAEDTVMDTIVKIITLGYFTNKNIDIYVPVSDIGAGIDSVTLIKEDGRNLTGEILDGKAVFRINRECEFELCIKAVDKFHNESQANCGSITVDKVNPGVVVDMPKHVYKDKNGNYWAKDQETFTVTLSDLHLKNDAVKVMVNDSIITGEILDNEIRYRINSNDYAGQDVLTIKYEAEDLANNKRVGEFKFNLDTKAPVGLELPTVRTKDGVEVLPKYNQFFSNDKLIIQFHLSDESGAGVKQVYLCEHDKQPVKKQVENNIVEFTVETELIGKLSVKAEDMVGNITEEVEISQSFCLETKKPELELNAMAEGINNGSNIWFNGEDLFTISIKDQDAGLQSIQVFVNESSELLVNQTYDQYINEDCFTFNPKDYESNENNGYVIKAVVIDNAGNLMIVEKEFFVDSKKPFFKEVIIGKKENNKFIPLTKEEIEEGIFAKNGLQVRAHVGDEKASSGLKEVALHGYNDTPDIMRVRNGWVTFTIDKTIATTLSLIAYDYVGNESDEYSIGQIINENQPPEVNVIIPKELYKSNNEYWIVNHVSTTINMNDYFYKNGNDSGLNPSKCYVKVNDQLITATEGEDGEHTYQFNTRDFELKNNRYVITYYAEDHSKNNVSGEIVYHMDQEKPSFTEKVISDSKGVKIEPIFGTIHSNKEVTVQFKLSDEDGCGVKSVTIQYGDYEETKLVENQIVSFNIKSNFIGTITAVATDFVGNTHEIPVGKFILENTPVVADVKAMKVMYTVNDKKWYNKENDFELKLSDTQSGIEMIQATINGVDVLVKENFESRQTELTYIVSTKDIKPDPNGMLKLVIKLRDNAGNESNYSTVVYQDNKKPQIDRFVFTPLTDENYNANLISEQKYGYFFKTNTKVTVYASDQVASAGMKTISYYTIDKHNKKSRVKDVNIQNGQISFMVPTGFKGQVYAYVTDNVTNRSPEKHPSGVVVETKEMHENNSSAKIEVKESNVKDSSGLNLYKENVSVLLDVSDTISGLKSVEWSVDGKTDDENNQKGLLKINDEGKLSSDSGWTIVTTDKNLVTRTTKRIIVSNNCNDIIVSLKLTDRAGYETKKVLHFSIDKTKPTIQVSYDNNQSDGTYTGIYKENRIATIIVTERNFTKSDVILSAINKNGSNPKISDWTTIKGTGNGDNTKHRITIEYSKDGDYTFDINCKDMANNQAESVTYGSSKNPKEFTIDKTKPVAEVEFNNNKVSNNNFYKKERVATIRITEHNFNKDRATITVTGVNKTQKIIPTISGWSTSGDVHTTSIKFDKDGYYTINVNYADMAGNNIEKQLSHNFYIDQSIPEMKVNGILDKAAYNKKDISFTVEVADQYLSSVTPKLTYIKRDGSIGEVNVAQVSFKEGRASYQVKELKEDGIYQFECKASDKAGNLRTEKIVFSVNRSGSTYMFDSATEQLKGVYTKDTSDVLINEINVDELDMNSIEITVYRGNTAIKLEPQKEYTIEKVNDNGKWCKYQYHISKDIFKKDGVYRVLTYSVDKAKNVSMNNLEEKAAELSFVVDNTDPLCTIFDLESGKIYSTKEKNLSFRVEDNMKLSKIVVYLNGVEIKKFDEEAIKKVEESGSNYTVTLPSSNSVQSIEIQYEDASGNKGSKVVNDFYITTDFFIQFYNNKVLFYSTIAGFVLVIVGITILFIVLRRKRER